VPASRLTTHCILLMTHCSPRTTHHLGERAKAIVAAELGKPIEQCFDSFETEPIAAASLGQAHRTAHRTAPHRAARTRHAHGTRTARTPHARRYYHLPHLLLTTDYFAAYHRCTAPCTRAHRWRSRCSGPASRSSSTPTSRTSRHSHSHNTAAATHLVPHPPSRLQPHAHPAMHCTMHCTMPCATRHAPCLAPCLALRQVLAKLLDKFDPKSDGADRSYADIYDESSKLLYEEIDYIAEGKNAKVRRPASPALG